METVSKVLSGIAAGGGIASSFLLFIFKGQNKKIDEIAKTKVDTSNFEIVISNINKSADETKTDIKDIKKNQIEQLMNLTEFKTILKEIKQNMMQRRRDDS
ncbi:MAG: hypothetical protein DRH26_13745 [Deltaproteobacteria bacterium]|nr:MAG: hypothetical protein DRH26_13745 [Deltaproteobacteria bacterium]